MQTGPSLLRTYLIMLLNVSTTEKLEENWYRKNVLNVPTSFPMKLCDPNGPMQGLRADPPGQTRAERTRLARAGCGDEDEHNARP